MRILNPRRNANDNLIAETRKADVAALPAAIAWVYKEVEPVFGTDLIDKVVAVAASAK